MVMINLNLKRKQSRTKEYITGVSVPGPPVKADPILTSDSHPLASPHSVK